jgi:hypothetical protein
MRTWNAKKQLLPESFVWQIFHSLLSAIEYLQNGPPTFPVEWDRITRRALQPYPFTVKLGDFGCGVTAMEYTYMELEVGDSPYIDQRYNPPEGAEPAESTDVYQIGLVLSMMYCTTGDPANDDQKNTIS